MTSYKLQKHKTYVNALRPVVEVIRVKRSAKVLKYGYFMNYDKYRHRVKADYVTWTQHLFS